jgi:uncharacterized DUF497 family protein
LNGHQFQFEWDEAKAAANVRKHDVSFELAVTIFADPRLISVADLAHSETEERWFSIGWASNGAMLSVVYLYWESDSTATRIRIISARRATGSEIRQYGEMP